MDYSKMSDVEIAVLVGKHISKDGQSLVGINGKACIHDYVASCVGELCIGWKEFDPCNSWADAGTIIEREKISLTCHQSRDFWAAIFNRNCMASHANPLRAAMECYLMMHDKGESDEKQR